MKYKFILLLLSHFSVYSMNDFVKYSIELNNPKQKLLSLKIESKEMLIASILKQIQELDKLEFEIIQTNQQNLESELIQTLLTNIKKDKQKLYNDLYKNEQQLTKLMMIQFNKI